MSIAFVVLGPTLLGAGLAVLTPAPGGQDPPAPAPAFPQPSPEEPKPETAGAGNGLAPSAESTLQDARSSAGPAAEPVRPSEVPVRASGPRSSRALLEGLKASAERSAGWLTIESIGTSADGRPIPLAVWRDPTLDPLVRGPAVFLGDCGRLEDPLAADALVDTVALLASSLGAAAPPSTDAAATAPPAGWPAGCRATILIAPLLDPDRRAALCGEAALAPRPARFERNFPVGWLPENLAAGGGARPLALPEVEAAARLILARAEVSLALTLEPELPTDLGHWLAALESERAAFAALLAWPPEAHASGAAVAEQAAVGLRLGLPQGAGSLHASWYGLAGTYPASVVPRGGRAPRPEELLALLQHAAELLPALELETSSVERLDQEHWLVDCRLANTGGLPTRGARAREFEGLGPIEVSLEGAELSAAAALPPGGAVQERLALRGGRAQLGDLDPGEERPLRLVVRGVPGLAFSIVARAPRAGAARLELSLE